MTAASRHPRRAITNEEIIERTIYALINEGARVLDEGDALRAADIDVIYLTGYGFPAFRGGPMFYADRVGLTKVHERVSGVPSRTRPALGAGAAPRAAGAGRDRRSGAGRRRADAVEATSSGCHGIARRAESGRSTSRQRDDVRHGPDGVVYLRRRRRSAPIPMRITDRLEHWADEAPDRVFLAQRDADRRLAHADLRGDARQRRTHLAGVARSASCRRERPILILSGNGIDHALLALAACTSACPTRRSRRPTRCRPGLRHAAADLRSAQARAGVRGRRRRLRARRSSQVLPSGVELVVSSSSPATIRVDTVQRATRDTSNGSRRRGARDGSARDTIAKILFTSGSTGQAEGRHQHAADAVLESGDDSNRDAVPRRRAAGALRWLPWNHTAGGNHNFGIVLYNGGTFYIDEGKPTPGALRRDGAQPARDAARRTSPCRGPTRCCCPTSAATPCCARPSSRS